MGDIEGRPFTATKLADYMDVPRPTILRRIARLERWGLVYRVGYKYFASHLAFNSIIGLATYRWIHKRLDALVKELSILDSRD